MSNSLGRSLLMAVMPSGHEQTLLQGLQHRIESSNRRNRARLLNAKEPVTSLSSSAGQHSCRSPLVDDSGRTIVLHGDWGQYLCVTHLFSFIQVAAVTGNLQAGQNAKLTSTCTCLATSSTRTCLLTCSCWQRAVKCLLSQGADACGTWQPHARDRPGRDDGSWFSEAMFAILLHTSVTRP